MAEERLDIIEELKENESFRYIVDTLHLFFNIPQPSDSTDIEEKIVLLQNKYEEIASANQQASIEEILADLVALKERLESQDQTQQERSNDIASIKEALEKIQQENTTNLKGEIEKLQNEHTSLREENESRISSMKEEVEKLQQEQNMALKEEIEKFQQENITELKEEVEKLRQENTSLKEELEKVRKVTEALTEDDKDIDESTFSLEDNELFTTMKDDINKLSKEAYKLKKEFVELKDQEQQSQLDDLRTMLEEKSLSPQYQVSQDLKMVTLSGNQKKPQSKVMRPGQADPSCRAS
ncbi:hypothetical protein D4764_06G0009920 [Takifugu flavidus]|uniref:Uncharacterized protein n=1 Tax=Takifugu flavidus TaxID=433684 RepID=A0A5C6MWI1_9TELE|nr:hypothetical protein D4764_06G0009920 [Takifugu flavidus]